MSASVTGSIPYTFVAYTDTITSTDSIKLNSQIQFKWFRASRPGLALPPAMRCTGTARNTRRPSIIRDLEHGFQSVCCVARPPTRSNTAAAQPSIRPAALYDFFIASLRFDAPNRIAFHSHISICAPYKEDTIH